MMEYDMIVVGGGPAGSSSAFFNAQKGKRVLLMDKQVFPRDKFCGDGITGKSLHLLEEMGLGEAISKEKKISSNGVIIYSPNKANLRIPIDSPDDPFSAFSLEREIIDNLIYERAKEMVLENGGDVITAKATGVISKDNKIIGIETKDGKYLGKTVVGAGGYNCPVSRYVLDKNQTLKQDRNHYSSAIREYWDNIQGSNGDFEIHFIKGIMPGYFWIFPISETRFNIGVGMLLADMDNQDVKLKQMLDYIINESYLSERFKGATAIEKSRKGWLLPLGSPRKNTIQPRKNFTDGCVLVGDAASLIDPFTGEGIGNALVSGKLTADYDIIDEQTGIEYQNKLWEIIGNELTNSHKLQKMLKREWLINWFIKKASKKPKLQEVLTDMLHNKESQHKMQSKWFMFKTLMF